MKNKSSFVFIFYFLVQFSLFSQENFILQTRDFQHYIEQFNAQDQELYPQMVPNDSAWAFLEARIPFFECPDKNIELTYYFRWWTFRKHIKKTPDGFVITEFLPQVDWSEKYNTIACAAGHHFYEGRWLKSDQILNKYAAFWFTEGNPRMYSFWAANALWEYYKVTQDSIVFTLLPAFIRNYYSWEKGWDRKGHFIGKNEDGLFSTYDDRDGMEKQISGSGKRPTINSYMYGDAMAIAEMAEQTGNLKIKNEFAEKAACLKSLVLENLWDKDAAFFKTRSEINDQLVDVRELQGYTPWYVNLPPKGMEYEKAWKFIRSAEGFNAPYGLTTAEQSHPLFQIAYEGHECLWDGPVWPFATSITLTALANVLNDYGQDVVSEKDFYEQFVKYSLSHRIIDENGNILPWIDENMNPFTGDWISRSRLKVWENNNWSVHKGGVERGKDYNHSTYCDNLISGLIGVRPQADNTLVVNPLIPEGVWDWFYLDGLSYKGKTITIVFDKDGSRYNKGSGFMIFADGKMVARNDKIGKLTIMLEK